LSAKVTALRVSVLGLTLAGSLAASASAIADSPQWSGAYAGIAAGYSWSESNALTTSLENLQACTSGGCSGGPSGAAASITGASGVWPTSIEGFAGGLQIGYTEQIPGGFVAGIEADIQGLSGSGRADEANVTPVPGFFPPYTTSTDLSVTKDIDWLGTVRGRLGFLVTPSLLIYGTGGLAYGKVESTTRISQSYNPNVGGVANNWGSFSSYSETRVGWTAGGGGEWKLAPKVSLKGEYLYYDLGSVSYSGRLVDGITVNNPPASAFFTNSVTSSFDADGHIARVGLNFYLN
jgi:outer membrane immunogenic protein